MYHDEFLTLLMVSAKKQRNVSILILIIGLAFAAGALANLDTMGTIGQLFLGSLGGLFILFAVFMIVKSVKMAAGIQNGSHPLVHAIMTGDQSFVLWIYAHVKIVNNVQRTANPQIWIYNSGSKPFVLFTKGSQTESIIGYISSRFPNALVGYTYENKIAYKKLKANSQ